MRFHQIVGSGIIFISYLLVAGVAQASPFYASINPIPKFVQQQMKQYTWRAGCPVSMNDLAYVRLKYWGFDQKSHLGLLIINKQRANEIIKIFAQLYDEKFPIQSMKPLYIYEGDDNKSMADNNTSAFNCRPMTGTTHKFSQHSYGTAVDINPLLNPYTKGDVVLPPAGAKYLDRSKAQPGMVTANSTIYQLFTKAGWTWGGNWHDLKDYQHFEKPLN